MSDEAPDPFDLDAAALPPDWAEQERKKSWEDVQSRDEEETRLRRKRRFLFDGTFPNVSAHPLRRKEVPDVTRRTVLRRTGSCNFIQLGSRIGACEKCGEWDRLELHHLKYDFEGDELPEDLHVLCHDCHHYGVHGGGGYAWRGPDRDSLWARLRSLTYPGQDPRPPNWDFRLSQLLQDEAQLEQVIARWKEFHKKKDALKSPGSSDGTQAR